MVKYIFVPGVPSSTRDLPLTPRRSELSLHQLFVCRSTTIDGRPGLRRRRRTQEIIHHVSAAATGSISVGVGGRSWVGEVESIEVIG